jgi:hypothetical protein
VQRLRRRAFLSPHSSPFHYPTHHHYNSFYFHFDEVGEPFAVAIRLQSEGSGSIG